MRCLIWFLPLLACLSPSGFSLAQSDGLVASRNQRRDLEPLVEFAANRGAFFLSSVDSSLVERMTRKAMANQNAHVVKTRLQEAIVQWIAMDLDLDSKAGREAVRIHLLADFGQALSPDEMDLAQPAPAGDTEGSAADEGELSEEERMRRKADEAAAKRERSKLKAELKTWPFQLKTIMKDHGECLRHSTAAMGRATRALGTAVDKDQARGCKELALHYAPHFETLFGNRGKDKVFREQLQEALSQRSTPRAMAGTLVKLRRLARPGIHAALELKPKDVLAVIDAEAQVPAAVCERLDGIVLWQELASDHRRMIADPKAHRRVIKARD